MKVLLLNTSDNQGGAARAAFRLHNSLNKINNSIQCEMLVLKSGTDDSEVYSLSNSLFHKARPSLEVLPLIRYKNRKKVTFSSSWVPFSGIIEKINEINPDIVHIHWVNAGFLRIEDLAKINRPLVWTLHDMWPFTGGCHYDDGCGKFKSICNKCPILRSDNKNDLSSKIFKRKIKAYKKIQNLTIVGLSRWLENAASKSLLFSNRVIKNLPNPIDTEVFKPIEKVIARELLNLPKKAKLILFGAMGGTSDKRKGFRELSNALINVSDDTELIIFGGNEPKVNQGFKQKAHYLGHVNDDITLKLIYNAADIMVVPSLQENLSNAIMESMACGTPVLAFDIGGNSDMIEHKKNGFLAEPYSSEELANGINWLIKNENLNEIAASARYKVINTFSSTIVATQYYELYKEILKNNEFA